MMVLVVLAGTYVLARLLPWPGRSSPPSDAARVAMATAMGFAGAGHLARPEPFVQHLPGFVPARERIILVTGVLELLLGAGLAVPHRRRREVALALAAYLVAVFPANVYVAAAGVEVEGLPGASHPWLRLPLQAVYVAWAFWAVPGSWELARTRARQLQQDLLARRGTTGATRVRSTTRVPATTSPVS
jgi:uncharacterized membrane protein